MPRQLKEINNFNLGIILNASEKDTPGDAATFSLNIDPLSENGILNAINTDKLTVSVGTRSTRLIGSLSWGDWNYTGGVVSGNYNKSNLYIEDIGVFDNEHLASLNFVGTIGRKEKLTAYNAEPKWERLSLGTTMVATLAYSTETQAAVSTSTAISIDNGSGAVPYESTAVLEKIFKNKILIFFYVF